MTCCMVVQTEDNKAVLLFWGYCLPGGMTSFSAKLFQNGQLPLILDLDETLVMGYSQHTLSQRITSLEKDMWVWSRELQFACLLCSHGYCYRVGCAVQWPFLFYVRFFLILFGFPISVSNMSGVCRLLPPEHLTVFRILDVYGLAWILPTASLIVTDPENGGVRVNCSNMISTLTSSSCLTIWSIQQLQYSPRVVLYTCSTFYFL